MIIGIVLTLTVTAAVLLLNHRYKKTHKYLQAMQQFRHMRAAKSKQYDIVCFGSMSAKYAFDFTDEVISGYNFGYMSQYLYYTDKMLREYYTCLKENSVVILALADMVFLKHGYGEFGGETQYYGILGNKNMTSYNSEIGFLRYLAREFPLLCHPTWIRFIFHDTAETNSFDLKENPHDAAEMKKLAEEKIVRWISQFHLMDTQNCVGLEFGEIFIETSALLSNMIDFCLTRGLKPVLLVLPVSETFEKQLGKDFMDSVLYANICRANIQGVPVIDFLRDQEFADGNLYVNADCLNKNGRRLFTKRVLSDLKKLGLILQ